MELYLVPIWVVLVVAIAVAVAITIGGRRLVHRLLPDIDFLEHNEVAGFLVAVVGTLYAVMLAFITSIVWTEYDAAQTRVAAEAAALADAWHLSAGLHEPVRSRMRADAVRYARTMIDREWPAMRHGASAKDGEALLGRLIADVASVHPHDAGEATVQNLVLHDLTDVHDARRYRLAANLAGVSTFQWTVMIIGAALVLGFCFLFGAKSEATLMFMNCAVAVVIVTTWVLIFGLDYPFRGDLAIGPEPFVTFLRNVSG